MPDIEPNNAAPSEKPTAVVYQSKGRSTRGSRRPSVEHDESEPKSIPVGGEMRISALGHEHSVGMPSQKTVSPGTASELADKVSVMHLSNAQKVVCITETKGHIRMINDIAKRHNARAVIHTGDFGFYDADSHKHMNVKELRNMVQFGPLSGALRNMLGKVPDHELHKACSNVSFSELGKFISGEERLEVPVYVVWGNQEDVSVLNKFADGSYHVPNLYILNQDSSFTISLDGNTLRLFGLGGAFLYHRFFDIGHGSPTTAGADGVMWSTLIQLGNLIDLSERYKDPNEVRILVTHVCPGKEGLVNVLANAIKADFTLSGALHGKFCHAYTDFSVRTLSNYLEHIGMAQVEIPRLWAHVLQALGEANIRESDRHAVERVLAALKDKPQTEADLKHIWHLNLTDAKHGHMLLAVADGQLKVETVVDHGWSLSAAREHPRRRSSLREHKPKETVKKVEHEAPVAAPVVPEIAASILTETPKVNSPFVVKITGFAAGTTQAELDQKFALKYYKRAIAHYLNDSVVMGFDEEAQFNRVVKNVTGLKHGAETLSVEVITANVTTSPTSPNTEQVEKKSHIESTEPSAPQPSEPEEKKASPILFGQRRQSPTDLKIEGLGW